jgi:succinate-acetate transporter protein
MGWGGAGGSGAATIGLYYFFGGMLQIIGSLLEWFIGNTFPFVVFGSFGMLNSGLRGCLLTITLQALSGSHLQRH